MEPTLYFMLELTAFLMGIVTCYVWQRRQTVGRQTHPQETTERKRIEEALQKSEALYRLMAENISDMITLHSTDGRFLYASPSYLRATGYSNDELLTMSREALTLLVHPEDLQRTHHEAHQQVLRGETVTRLEYRRKKKDGSYFWVQADSTPIFDKEGQMIQVLASSRDITERKQAEEKLRHSEQYFSLLVNSVHDYGIYTLNAAGQVVTWNPGAERLKGYRAEEIIGRNYAMFYTPDDVARGEPQRILETATREGWFAGEGWRVRKNGMRFWAEVSLSVLHDESGQMMGFSKVVRDLTQRKLIEDTLHHQNDYLKSLHNTLLKLLSRHTMSSDLLGQIVNDAALLLDAPYAELMLLEGDSLVVRAYTANQPFLQGDRVKRDESLLSWQAHDRLQPIIVNDYMSWPQRRELYQGLQLRAVADFPITIGSVCIGVLGLSRSKENAPFTEDQIQIGMMFSYLAALVVDNANQYDAALQEIDERKKTEERLNALSEELHKKHQMEQEQRILTETLRDTVAALNSTLELDEIFKRILENIRRIIPHDTANIMLIDEGIARIVQHTGTPSPTMMSGIGFPVEQTPHLNLMCRTRHSYIIDDAATVEGWLDPASSDDSISYLAAPICVDDTVIGFLNMGSMTRNHFTANHAHRLQAFVNHAAVALKNARLYKRSLELAALEERQRLARDLHDSVTQTLFAASVTSKAIAKQWQYDSAGIGNDLLELCDLTQGALAEMRTLLLELRPNTLLDSNLSDLLRQLTETLKGRARLAVTLEIEGYCVLPSDVKIAFFRIAQESLNNVIKHARAKHLHMQLNGGPHDIEMMISDDGIGFDASHAIPHHLGIEIMKERACESGITLHILTNIGQGTIVKAVWLSKDKS